VKISKRFILGPALALAAVAFVIVGVAAAQSTGEATTTPKNRIIEKAAEQFGVDPTALSDAIKQAQRQLWDEKLDEYLAAAVTAGTVTQEEADAIKAWKQARPAALDKLGHGMFGLPKLHGRGHHGKHGFGRHVGFFRYPAPETTPSSQSSTKTGTNL
jgi:hypothetical protein